MDSFDIAPERLGGMRRAATADRPPHQKPVIEIGLVNNMPDAVLRRTEDQFHAIVREAVAGQAFDARLHLLSIAEIARGETAKAEIGRRYRDVGAIAAMTLDALIITGCEPRAPRLRDEPYWASMTRLAEWAENNVHSAIWSCLAAHVIVERLDQIERRPIGAKRFGVYDCDVRRGHALARGLSPRILTPHSRYNEVAEDDLLAAGYEVLTRSALAGVDLFVKQRKDCLFVFFQGHPEYDAMSLWHEYRRDVLRFLNSERDNYPAAPLNYLNEADAGHCLRFEQRARQSRNADLAAALPAIDASVYQSPWTPSAVRVYRNWLTGIAELKQVRAKAPKLAALL